MSKRLTACRSAFFKFSIVCFERFVKRGGDYFRCAFFFFRTL